MNELLTVLTAVLPVFGVMVVGFWLRRAGWLTADADQSLMRLTIHLLLPSLIFDSVLGNAALRRPENLLLPPLLGYGMMAVGVGVARCFAGLAGARTKPERRTFAFVTGLQNYSYLTIPLCLSLFGTGTMGVLFVHNVGTDMAMWTLGLATLAGGWTGAAGRKF
jgi:malate permease and related proteins